MAITSLTPRVLTGDMARRVAVARACNEFDATLIRDHPARFGGLAMLPLPHIDGSLEEVAYALDELRLDGVGLYSSTDGARCSVLSRSPLDVAGRREGVLGCRRLLMSTGQSKRIPHLCGGGAHLLW